MGKNGATGSRDALATLDLVLVAVFDRRHDEVAREELTLLRGGHDRSHIQNQHLSHAVVSQHGISFY